MTTYLSKTWLSKSYRERHLIAQHGFTSNFGVWTAAALREQHIRYHEDETAKHLDHTHRGKF